MSGDGFSIARWVKKPCSSDGGCPPVEGTWDSVTGCIYPSKSTNRPPPSWPHSLRQGRLQSGALLPCSWEVRMHVGKPLTPLLTH